MKVKFLILILALSATCNYALAGEPLNRIVAIVNDDIITASELKNREVSVMEQLQKQQTEMPATSVLRKQILDRLVLENLQLQIAERGGVRVDDELLNTNLRTLAKKNNMTLGEFRNVLENDGYDFVSFREDFRKQIIMNKIRQQMVNNRIQISEREVDNLLAEAQANNIENREYRLSHILISIPEDATSEELDKATKRAESILERVKSGENFEKVAIETSDGQQALEGGDLGWRKSGKLPSLFSNAVHQLKKGQLSDVIRSPSGFHIIRIKDVRGDDRRLIQQTLASHILLRTEEVASEEEVHLRIEQLRERVLQGEEFATLASAHSQDPGSASQDGSLGWVTPGEMVEEFENTMDKLAIQQVSEPFKTRFGWHIIKVMDRRTHDDTAKYQRARARESLHQLRVSEELEIWLRRLRDEAYVEYHLSDS